MKKLFLGLALVSAISITIIELNHYHEKQVLQIDIVELDLDCSDLQWYYEQHPEKTFVLEVIEDECAMEFDKEEER